MTRISTLLSAFVSLSIVFASPIIEIRDNLVTLPIVARFNLSGEGNFAERQRHRAKHLISNGNAVVNGQTSKRAIVGNVAATNVIVTYTASVGVGSPPTKYNLLIDTGSSNTWVGAHKAYKKTKTSKDTGHTVSVTYGSGSFSGEEFIDQVTLSPKLVIKKQSIGVAHTSTGFDSVDGILGIGPTDLTKDTVSNTKTVPTVTDNLFSQKTIKAHEVSVSYEPTTSTADKNGELTFGGTDPTKFTGHITYAPITKTAPASAYWGIDESIKYNGKTILKSRAGIVDTGTTLVLIATDAFDEYQKATGGVLDSNTGLLKITKAQFKALKPLNFIIGGKTFSMTPNAQIFPRSLNTHIGGVAGDIYLIVADIGTASGQGLDFINGYAFLERFYSVYDTANKRVGLATTRFTDATTN